MLAVLPKRPAPGVVVVVPLPAFPNRPPEPPEAGAEVLAPALPNRLPPDDRPAVLVAPNRPPPVAGVAVLFPKILPPEPIVEHSVSLLSI